MKNKKIEDTTSAAQIREMYEVRSSENEIGTLKQAASLLNKLSKQHSNAKDLLSEASHDFALLKAILKYEKKTTTRPEEIYIENIKKRLDTNLCKLNDIYGKKEITEKTISTL